MATYAANAAGAVALAPLDPDIGTGAQLDYTIDWSAWLGTDTIATSTWTLPSQLAKATDSNTTTTTTVWLRNVSAARGAIYQVTNTITTAAGRTEQRSFSVRVADK